MDEAKIVTNTDYVVTETTFDAKQDLPEIIGELRSRKTTGQFIVHLSQGGIQKIALTEKTKMGAVAEKVRNVLGWDTR